MPIVAERSPDLAGRETWAIDGWRDRQGPSARARPRAGRADWLPRARQGVDTVCKMLCRNSPRPVDKQGIKGIIGGADETIYTAAPLEALIAAQLALGRDAYGHSTVHRGLSIRVDTWPVVPPSAYCALATQQGPCQGELPRPLACFGQRRRCGANSYLRLSPRGPHALSQLDQRVIVGTPGPMLGLAWPWRPSDRSSVRCVLCVPRTRAAI